MYIYMQYMDGCFDFMQITSQKSIIILKQTKYLTWQYLHDVSIMYVNMNKCGSLFLWQNHGTYWKIVLKATSE